MSDVRIDKPSRQALPWLAGGAALAAGLLVYALGRPAGHAMLLPLLGSPAGHRWGGWVGGWLPSFVHPFAFSLFCAALLRPRPRVQHGVCAFWFVVNAAFEVGQHPQVRAPLVDALRLRVGDGALARSLARYLEQGTFDTADLMAAALGAAAAAALLRRIRNREASPHENRNVP